MGHLFENIYIRAMYNLTCNKIFRTKLTFSYKLKSVLKSESIKEKRKTI